MGEPRKHHVLIVPTHPDPGWQAWCKPCRWESAPTAFLPLARRAGQEHQDDDRPSPGRGTTP